MRVSGNSRLRLTAVTLGTKDNRLGLGFGGGGGGGVVLQLRLASTFVHGVGRETIGGNQP